MRIVTILALLGLACAARTAAAGPDEKPPLETVPYVDIQRYLGTWYEIATIPQRFQKGCTAVTATYSLRKDGAIEVVNSCRKGSLDGPRKSVRGKAWVVDKRTNAKLKVRFFWPFSGDYWVIGLDVDYRWAVVGHPGRKYLWILSRTPQMSEDLYRQILELVRAHGYELGGIKKTLQPS